MKKLHYKTREEWERMRDGLIAEGRIGGSMVGTACGLDPWKSPYRLWAEMTGRIEKEDISDREPIVLGHDLEDYVAERFCRLTGKKVHRENCIMTSDDAPHLFASIDRKISNEESGLECKTASAYRDGAFSSGSFPDGYFRQVKTYLKVTGLERWYLAVLVMGVAFRVFLVTTREEDLKDAPGWLSGVRYVSPMELDECEEEAAAFIEGHVRADVPPDMVGSEDERGAVAAVHGNASSGTVELGDDVEALIAKREALKKSGEDRDAELKAVENAIVAALGGAEEGVGALHKVTFKYAETKRLDKALVAKAFGGTVPDECYKVSRGATLRISPVRKNYK